MLRNEAKNQALEAWHIKEVYYLVNKKYLSIHLHSQKESSGDIPTCFDHTALEAGKEMLLSGTLFPF